MSNVRRLEKNRGPYWEDKMIINKNQKLEKAVGNHFTRPCLAKIHYDGEKYLTATDGKMLIQVQVDGSDDAKRAVLLPVQLYTAA